MQTADPQVVQATNELLQVYGGACQQGHQQAYGQMEQAYHQTQQAINEGRFRSGSANNYSRYDHSQRMQEIHNWGQQRLEWGNQQSAIQDNNHQQFLEYLRQ